MNRCLLVAMLFVGLTLFGCSNDDISGENPPKVFIEIGKEKYETILGTYCWENTCIDTVGPIEILKDEEPIRVKPGEIISLTMNYEPKPNEFSVMQMSKDGEQVGTIQDNQFTVPDEKGIYYYYYATRWKDQQQENVSHGDAYYAFALEVGL